METKTEKEIHRLLAENASHEANRIFVQKRADIEHYIETASEYYIGMNGLPENYKQLYKNECLEELDRLARNKIMEEPKLTYL